MREYIEQATQDIAVGLDPDVVINALLLEKSIWRPHSRVDVPLLGRKKIPGGLTGLGATAYGAYKGYKASKEAKKKGLKGKEKAKHIAKGALKGAARGAVAGYGAQLAQRRLRSKLAKQRHAGRRSESYWTTLKTKKGDDYYRGSGVVKKGASEAAKEAARKKARTTSRKVRHKGEREKKTREAEALLGMGAEGLALGAFKRSTSRKK